MHLSIRWKFILSIGITLIVTYLGLLTWDYWWQRGAAATEMQQKVAERAETLANSVNYSLNAIESSIANVTNELSAKPPASEDALRALLAPRQWPQSLRNPTELFIAFDAQYAAASNLQQAYVINLGQPGGRGRQGGGRGGRGGQQPPDDRGPGEFGGRGGQPDQRSGQPDQRGGRGAVRGIQFDRTDPGMTRGEGRGGAQGMPNDGPPDGGRFGGPGFGPRGGGFNPGGPQILIEPLPGFNPATEQFYLRAIEQKRAVWIDPHLIRAGNGPRVHRVTFSYPMIVNDRVIGVVAAAITIQYAAGGMRGAIQPATLPSDPESGALLRNFAIIGNAGRVIYPEMPGVAQRASIVEWAKGNELPELASDLTSIFDGESSAVKVYRLHDAPEILRGAQAGEYYWVAFAPVPTTDWVVTSAISESQYMSPTIQRLWHRALFLVGGLLALLGVTAFVSIRVSRPIEKMARAVNELASGNLDAHVTEVDSRDELGQLAGAFNTMTGQLKQHIAALTEQTAARETVEAELRIARQIQTDLLPKTFPPFPNRREFTLHAINVPAHRVAGDFYDFFFASEDLLTVVIADVSGKGVPAALLMAVTRTIVRNLAMEGLSPSQIAERANAMLLADISDSMFVTMFLCLYDTRTGKIVYVNAGHPKPYFFGSTGEPKPFGDITGALLGVCPSGPEWKYEQHEAQLEVGQTLLLYTDGVTEARAPSGSMLRNEGVELLIKKHQSEPVATLCNSFVQELNEYQAGQPADDVTLVALERVL